jgi:hypothetical protein
MHAGGERLDAAVARNGEAPAIGVRALGADQIEAGGAADEVVEDLRVGGLDRKSVV